MPEPPELTQQQFEILVVRELRKAGLAVAELRIYRRATLPEPERGYLVELKGVLGGAAWRPQSLVACRRQDTAIGRAAVESLRDHVKEAGAEAGFLFGAADFDPEALAAALDADLALLRVTDGRSAFDTSGWGPPGHYPAWLPAYCAQLVTRDPLGQPRYQLLGPGQGDQILHSMKERHVG